MEGTSYPEEGAALASATMASLVQAHSASSDSEKGLECPGVDTAEGTEPAVAWAAKEHTQGRAAGVVAAEAFARVASKVYAVRVAQVPFQTAAAVW